MIDRVVSTYLYGAFDCMLLSCHIRVSEWIYTQQFCLNVKELEAGAKQAPMGSNPIAVT